MEKAVHEKFGTVLLATSSADFQHLNIKDKLKSLLKEAGVPIKEKTAAELYDMIIPPNSKQEKAFIRLIATFVTLVKSSCKSIGEVLRQINDADDERSAFIVKNIFNGCFC